VNLIANIVTFLVLSLVTGLGSAWLLVDTGPGFTGTSEGPWQSWSRIGRATADPYTRAHITRSGRLLVMSKSMLYYSTIRDSDGRKIDSECDYAISGYDPGNSWWSLAAYDGAGNLMTNPAARYAYNASNIMRNSTGGYRISLSKIPMPGNWLPVDSDYQVRLILRLHRDAGNKISPGEPLGLPDIRRVACR